MLSFQSSRKFVSPKSTRPAEIELSENVLNPFGFEDACRVAWTLVLRLHAVSDSVAFDFSSQDQPEAIQYSAEVGWQSKLVEVLDKLHQSRMPKQQSKAKRDAYNTLLECYHRSDKETTIQDQNSNISIALRIHLDNGKVKATLHSRSEEVQHDQASNLLRIFAQGLHVVRHQNKDTAIDQISWCSGRDQRQLERWTSRISQLVPTRLDRLVSRQAALTPDATALVFENVELTYGELDHWSSNVAAMLVQKHGLVAPSTVILLFNRGVRPFVAMLAAFKAGCAFVACDPAYGQQRLADARSRCGSSVVLTEEEFIDSEWTCAFNTKVMLESDSTASDAYDHRLLPQTHPEDPCFLLFTSGSTQTAKSVLQQHNRFATAILDFARVMDINESTRMLCAEPFSFDICYVEFFATLSRGGRCCVASSRAPNDLDGLYRRPIKQYGCTMLLTTPTVLSELDASDYPSLETVCSLGEPLPASILRDWAPAVQLNNQYGMSECGVWVAYNLGLDVSSNTSIVGNAGSGAIWLVNPSNHQELMPIGAVGEILIEGPNTAVGYVGDNCGRADSFLPTPKWFRDIHRDRRAERFFRSNDLGRYCPDGTIEYLGRKDSVQKFYGISIDIDEIEQEIKSCLNPGDRLSASVVEEVDGKIVKQVLSAFICLGSESKSRLLTDQLKQNSDLRSIASSQSTNGDRDTDEDSSQSVKSGSSNGFHLVTPVNGTNDQDKKQTDFHNLAEVIRLRLRQTFPPYMVPTKFYSISEIPMTPSGKTNRKRLRDPSLLIECREFEEEEF